MRHTNKFGTSARGLVTTLAVRDWAGRRTEFDRCDLGSFDFGIRVLYGSGDKVRLTAMFLQRSSDGVDDSGYRRLTSPGRRITDRGAHDNGCSAAPNDPLGRLPLAIMPTQGKSVGGRDWNRSMLAICEDSRQFLPPFIGHLTYYYCLEGDAGNHGTGMHVSEGEERR